MKHPWQRLPAAHNGQRFMAGRQGDDYSSIGASCCSPGREPWVSRIKISEFWRSRWLSGL